jgi:hypothetical protein
MVCSWVAQYVRHRILAQPRCLTLAPSFHVPSKGRVLVRWGRLDSFGSSTSRHDRSSDFRDSRAMYQDTFEGIYVWPLMQSRPFLPVAIRDPGSTKNDTIDSAGLSVPLLGDICAAHSLVGPLTGRPTARMSATRSLLSRVTPASATYSFATRAKPTGPDQ